MPYKDKNKALASQRQHWAETYARNGEKIRARRRAAYLANPEKAKEAQTAFRLLKNKQNSLLVQ